MPWFTKIFQIQLKSIPNRQDPKNNQKSTPCNKIDHQKQRRIAELSHPDRDFQLNHKNARLIDQKITGKFKN
jgi:hypothetical protein